jgi:phosphoglycolate phosphatase-like HAD superfamily hydrolase
MNKTLLLFDVDGTLVYSSRNDSLSFAETYEELYQRPFPTIDWHTYPHVTDTTILESVLMEHFGRACAWEEIELFQDRYIARMEAKRRVDDTPYREVPFARQTLGRLLSDERFAVGIATGGWKRPATYKLNYLGFPVAAIPLTGADHKRTREDILEEAIGEIRSRHSETLRVVYIGDALWDVRTTARMQLDFVGIRVKGDVELLRREGVGHVFSSFEDYEGFVEAVMEAKPPGGRSF